MMYDLGKNQLSTTVAQSQLNLYARAIGAVQSLEQTLADAEEVLKSARNTGEEKIVELEKERVQIQQMYQLRNNTKEEFIDDLSKTQEINNCFIPTIDEKVKNVDNIYAVMNKKKKRSFLQLLGFRSKDKADGNVSYDKTKTTKGKATKTKKKGSRNWFKSRKSTNNVSEYQSDVNTNRRASRFSLFFKNSTKSTSPG
jgi:hypothetical protein